jgi:hypothetical protein
VGNTRVAVRRSKATSRRAAVVPSCGFGCARREEHTKEESDHNEPEQAFAVSSGASQKSEKNKT